MDNITTNSNLHFEHKQWQSELAFWEDELKLFKNKLSELITRGTAKDVMIKLEHFQNEFIMHGGIIEDLKEAIEEHEIRIAGQSLTNLEVLDTEKTRKHFKYREKMEIQRQIYIDLKKDFFNFLTTYK